jgi:hypothetical protein
MMALAWICASVMEGLLLRSIERMRAGWRIFFRVGGVHWMPPFHFAQELRSFPVHTTSANSARVVGV